MIGISPQLQRFQLRPNRTRLAYLRRHGQIQAHAVATKAHLSGVVDSGAGTALPEDFHSVWHRLGGGLSRTHSLRGRFSCASRVFGSGFGCKKNFSTLAQD